MISADKIFIIIMAWFFILSIIVIYIEISGTKLKKEIDEEYIRHNENKQKTIDRLTKSLVFLCKLLNIDLSYHEYLGSAAGRILYTKSNGRFMVETSKIEILNKYESTPFVLAHELGHYMAIKQRQDNSEKGADVEALKLCKTILTPDEQKYITNELHIYFEKQF